MALAFYSSGHGAGKLPQSSSLIGTFKTAQTEDEQPIIPPNSLFDGLSPSPLEGTHVDGNKMPVIAECAVHLELLEAFLVLKEKIYTSNALDRTFAIRPEDKFVTQYRSRRKVRQPDKTFQTRRAVKWPIYIRLAAVRFLQWWGKLDGILKSYQDARCGTSSNELSSNMKSSQGLPNKVQKTDAILPPLDVLMVWHAFMLNPKKYEEFCHRSGRSEMSSLHFPWQSIHRAIHHSNRSFNLQPEAAALFKKRVGEVDLFDSLADFNSHEAASQSLFQAMGKSAPSPKEKNPSQAEMTLFETHISLFITDPLLNLPGSEQNSLLRELSDAVLRQASFVEKMGKRLWIRSPAVEGTLTRAIVRYERFLQMFKEHPGALLVPTLDIDLVWHTHQCSPQCYHSASINRAGRFINHDDTVKETILTDKFKETRRLYEIRFKEEYNACLCWDCEALKSELERISLDTEVDFPKLARKVELEVAYCKAVEKARRAGQKMLPILDENNRQ